MEGLALTYIVFTIIGLAAPLRKVAFSHSSSPLESVATALSFAISADSGMPCYTCEQEFCFWIQG